MGWLDTRNRPYYPTHFGPLVYKNLKSVLFRKFMTQYGYRDKAMIARHIIDDILQTINQYEPAKKRMQQGQIIYYTVKLKSRTRYKVSTEWMKLVPVTLNLFTDEEKIYLKSQDIGRERWKRLKEMRIVRLANEAKKQGGVLSITDLALITTISDGLAGKIITAYEQRTGDTVPIRCVEHETGSKISHKLITIEKLLSGKLSPDIAKEIQHNTKSVDRYIDSFRRVYLLSSGYTACTIYKITKMPPYVIKQYLKMIKEYYPQKYIKEFDTTKHEPEEVPI
jgi:hypothetical protein